MITLRRADERLHERVNGQKAWQTFHRQSSGGPLAGGFGSLAYLDELRLAPGGDVAPHQRRDAEIVTYVREGAVAFEDSTGRSGVIQAGEVALATVGRGIRHSQTNASPTKSAHLFVIWLRPAQVGLAPSHAQGRFSQAERRGVLRAIASPDGRTGSLRLNQDALVYSALLERGQHLVYDLHLARRAWLHVVQGELEFASFVLTAGDGAGLTSERAVSVTGLVASEILIIDVGEAPGVTQ